MVSYKRGWTWLKKARCSSREVSFDGCLRERVIVTDEVIERFFCPITVGHHLRQGKAPTFYLYHVDVSEIIHRKLVSDGGR